MLIFKKRNYRLLYCKLFIIGCKMVFFKIKTSQKRQKNYFQDFFSWL